MFNVLIDKKRILFDYFILKSLITVESTDIKAINYFTLFINFLISVNCTTLTTWRGKFAES
jgi:hypothetical protein